MVKILIFFVKGVSVVVCCFNSTQRLPNTLKSIFNQEIICTRVEVVIVDNNSNDGTAKLAERVCNAYCLTSKLFSFKIVFESKPGLIYARIAGVNSASNDLILFCDDDNYLFPNYISLAAKLMKDEAIGILGGNGIAKSDIKLPEWFEDNSGLFAVGNQRPDITYHLYGAGLITRKQIFTSIYCSGYPFISEGRKGTGLSSGEDTEFCYIVKLLGYKLSFNKDLQFYHLLPASRLSDNYLQKLKIGIESSFVDLIFYRYIIEGKKMNIVVWFKDIAYVILRLALDFQRLCYLERNARIKLLKKYFLFFNQYRTKGDEIENNIRKIKISLSS